MRAAVLVLLVAAPAAAEPRRGTVIDIGRRDAALVPAEPSSRLIYMHRCPAIGCAVTQGDDDDSRTNTSSIAEGSRVIGEFKQTQAVWDALMACMRKTYAPFDIGITDVDPGSVPHYEHMLGGVPGDLRSDIMNAGGVAPFDCAEIPNAITYTFDVYGPDPDQLCWTAAQETAHAFGLEHETNPLDPMSYLGGAVPNKRFQFAEAQCGEFAPRACRCGGTTMQSSYLKIVALFGPGAPTAPEVEIRAPSSGKRVQPHFVTKIDAIDDIAIDRVELYIDGMLAGEARVPPYWIAAPDGFDHGPHTVEARAFDVQGTPASTMIDVELGPPCTASKGCDRADACVGGVCVPGPDTAGGLGSFCTANTECLSNRCQSASDGNQACVEVCELTSGSCPSGFFCLADGAGAGVCWRSDDTGCCAAGARPGGSLLLGLGVLAALRRRRRPR
jgi:hypothetical protein